MDKSIPLVQAEALGRSYGVGVNLAVALAPATFTIHAGERIALVGPSGSGKSTLLGLVAGHDRTNDGRIIWPALGTRDGHPASIAVAFQAPSLIPSLNVLENAILPLLLAGQSQSNAEDQAMIALARFGVRDLAAKLPEQISGGQAHRVVLARATAAQPRLLLADEPTGQLDHATGLETIDALLEWSAQSNCAIVIATHDPTVAGRMETSWSIEHGILQVPSATPVLASEGAARS